jgi:iron complex transport system ATP-binding protein
VTNEFQDSTFPPAAGHPVLKLDRVDVVRGGKTLLNRISLAIHAGERWALLGANGAGKSTLLGLCGALAHPTRGTVDVLGKRLGRVDIRELRESIGHVNPRHPLQSALTVEEVVLTGATGSVELMSRWQPSDRERARVDQLLGLLGMGAKSRDPWTNLSQGERGRVLIARALLPSPRLLLLDEPSTGLDVASREQLLDTLDQVHAAQPELASILVTHHLEELPTTTTHAALLRRGSLDVEGPAGEVLTTDLVSQCFDYPLQVERSGDRWTAKAIRRSAASVI